MTSLDQTLTEWNMHINREVALRNRYAKDVERLKLLFHNAETKGQVPFQSSFQPLSVQLGGRPVATVTRSAPIQLPIPQVPAASTSQQEPMEVEDVENMTFVKDGTGRYPCPICGKHNKYLDTHRAHMRKHLCQWLICEKCGKKFTHSKAFKKHLAFHKRGQQHICHVCHHKSENPANARSHLQTHAKKSQYQCPLENCGRFLSQASEFNRHLRGVHKIDPQKTQLKLKVVPSEFITRREYLISKGLLDPNVPVGEGEEDEYDEEDEEEEEELDDGEDNDV